MDDNDNLKKNIVESAREILDGAGIKIPEKPEKDDTIYDEYGNPIEQAPQETQVDYSQYQSVQTQSLVKSSREEADEQLAQISAYNEEMARRQAAIERSNKIKRVIIYILIGIIFLAVIVAGGWMLMQVFSITNGSSDPISDPSQKPNDPGAEVSTVVDGYECTNKDCEKVADFPGNDDRILLRDGSKYYVYDAENTKITLTSIDEQEYHAINIFTWGDSILATLDPESDKTAIYSITSNCLISDYIFDKVYTSIDDPIYGNMTSVYGTYIAGYGSSYYRLINVGTHSEVVKSVNAIFLHDNYLFDYEDGGYITIYNISGTTKIARVDASKNFIATKNGNIYIIKVSNNTANITGYNSIGTKLTTKDSVISAFNKIKSAERASSVKKDKTFYKIPMSVSYGEQ